MYDVTRKVLVTVSRPVLPQIPSSNLVYFPSTSRDNRAIPEAHDQRTKQFHLELSPTSATGSTRQIPARARIILNLIMASRILSAAMRLSSASAPFRPATRSFQTSSRRYADAVATPLPVRKPVGAFRGGSV